MKIAALRLKNFKKFASLEIDFQEGINVVLGNNEAGKTTILKSILTALYTDPNTRSKKVLEDITTWQTEELGRVEIDLTENEKHYILSKDFQQNEILLTNQATDKVLKDPSLITKALEKLNPIVSESVYKSTALISQSDIAKIDSPKDLSIAIERAVSSGGTKSLEDVEKEIKKQISELTRGINSPAKNPGKLKTVRDRISSVEEKLADHRKIWTKRSKAVSQSKATASELEELKHKVELIEKNIEYQKVFDRASEKLKDIDKRITKLQERINRVEEIHKRLDEVDLQKKQYEDFDVKDLDSIAEKLTTRKAQIQAKEKYLGQLEKETQKDAQGESKLSLLGATGFGVLGIVLGSVVNVVFFSFVVLGVLVFVYYKFFRTGSLDKNQEQIQETRRTLNKQREELKDILAKFGVDSSKAFFAKRIRYSTIKEEIRRLEAEMRGVLGEETFQQLKEEQVKYFAEKKEIEVNELTEEVRASHLTPEKYLEKRRDLDRLKVKVRNLERQNIESELMSQEEGSTNYAQLVELEETLEQERSLLSGLEEELKILEVVLETINLIKNDLTNIVQTQVFEKIGEDIEQITKGRYKQVRLADGFNIEVFSEEKNDWIDPLGVLSSGTIDQIYFVYRLALLKVIEGQKRVPLLLDDVFVSYDVFRKGAAKKILERESLERQIILFTHSNDYKDWGHQIEVNVN